MSAGRAARAILVLLHIEAVTRALPEPFSASFPERESEAGCIFQCASEHPCILIVSAVSSFSAFFFSSFPATFSSSSSLRRVVRLIIAVMPRGVKVYTTRPLVVDESTTRSILPDRRTLLAIIARRGWNGTKSRSPARSRCRN